MDEQKTDKKLGDRVVLGNMIQAEIMRNSGIVPGDFGTVEEAYPGRLGVAFDKFPHEIRVKIVWDNQIYWTVDMCDKVEFPS